MTDLAACDTSLLVPALLSWHPAHAECRELLATEVGHVPAHVLLECFSVMTRLPAPHRVATGDAASVLGALSLTPVVLPASHHLRLVAALAAQGLRGGAIYDALVASTAAHHGLRLVTRDRRATATYDAVGVTYTIV